MPTVAVSQVTKQSHIAKSPKLTDTLIVPGERVGSLTQKTSKQDLIALFGAANLTDRTISGAEGEGKYPATQVNSSRGRSLLVVWQDQNQNGIGEVRILGSAWKTPEGIGIGTSMNKLRRILGDFELFGLEWDYGGIILLKSSRLSRYLGKLTLEVTASPDASNKFPQDFKAVLGDSTFSASNPHWKHLGIKVSRISVTFNRRQ
jgi:hypothetical protein